MPELELDGKLYEKFCELIQGEAGLVFDERKRTFVLRRLERRMLVLGASSYLDYYQMLRYGSSKDELQNLIEALTTHETYFFREFPQLRAFAEDILPEILERKEARGENCLRLWSAGCSTGEEAYTLAIILREMIPNPAVWNLSIQASDISRLALRTARRGLYDERSLRDAPTVYRQKYFTSVKDGYQLDPSIQQMVNFEQVNLLELNNAQIRASFDFVFCRNVLIYFNERESRRVVEAFYDALVPGGYIFLGHSESVGRLTSAFRLVRRGDLLVYCKPLERAKL